jgi:hypothetical protein
VADTGNLGQIQLDTDASVNIGIALLRYTRRKE